VAGRRACNTLQQLATSRSAYVLAAFLAAAGILLLAYMAPLTYDEAFNRIHYRDLGITKTLETYDYPNNHVPFTVLQLLIPQSLVTWNPWAIRIISVLCGIALISALVGLAYLRRTTPLLILLATLGSPILSTYLFVARGYGFSALWLVVAAALPVAAGRDRRLPFWATSLAAVALAIATWPLPINFLLAPGWVAAIFAIWGGMAAVSAAAVYVATAALMFMPILGQIQDNATYAWNGHPRFWSWFGDLVFAMNVVPACLIALLIVTSAVLIRERSNVAGATAQGLGRGYRLAALAGAMCASWFLLLAVAQAAGLIDLPFVRTAVPVLWLAVVALVAAVPRGRVELIAAGLLLPGAIWGCAIWSSAVVDGNWRSVAHASRTEVLYGTTPRTIRDLSRIGANRISCSVWDVWVCRLVTPNLQRSGISVVGTTSIPRLSHCAVGSRRPPSKWRVAVYEDGKLLGILCH
jgi:hypothetical protein